MATGKVRIFELAKEVGLTSKELISLFNERLGGVFEAKNHLSVVPDQIADLVRTVLLKPSAGNGGAAKKAAAEPAEPKVPARKAAPKERPRQSQAPASEAPIPRLRPVPSGQTSIAPKPAVPKAPPPARPQAARPGVAPRPGQPAPPGPAGRLAPAPTRTPVTHRPAGNGPFRPITGPRLAPGTTESPAPSSGARPGERLRTREEKIAAKKDRETEMLVDKERQRKKKASTPAPERRLETIEIPDLLTVQELATSMIVPAKDVIAELIKTGTMATINQNIPSNVAIAVAKKFGFNAVVKEAGEEVTVEQEADRPEMMTARPPVVTVLGHVDHGKTSLLDKIRQSNVAAGEAGGITQKIGAYTVEHNDRAITFIDTPGHEAFTAMRARGAKVTDVAILVVAADDGVMPQTKEAISHVRAANVPIVVAMNKMDKPDAQPDRVKQQLAEAGLQPVDWGGNVECVPVSARTGDGIAKLLETVLLEADIRELRANKNRRATGVVIESVLDRGRGAVATVLVQNGTLRVGDVVVAGGAFGKVRALIDDTGRQVKKAGPSIPVSVMGLSDVPAAGDTLMAVSDERVAREAAEKRQSRRRDVRIAATGSQKVSLETFMSMMPSEGRKVLNLILKADGQGSVEALSARMDSLSTDDVEIRVIHRGVGAISPNDVNLASASGAVLIGFNIRPDETAKRLATQDGVDLRFYQVIYEIEDDLRKAMHGMLAPIEREITLGQAEVRQVFKVSKVGTIVGCYVRGGKLQRGARVRVVRDGAVVFDGEIESLRRFKEDVRDVAEGFECGVQIAKFQDLKERDVLEAYAKELVAPEPVHA
ncbi:MAG: translation initiation factor IF-2 [Candidatus Tyrphobacter sp.]